MYTCLKAKSATQITIVLKSIQILILVQFFAYLMTALAILLSEYSIHTADFEEKKVSISIKGPTVNQFAVCLHLLDWIKDPTFPVH